VVPAGLRRQPGIQASQLGEFIGIVEARNLETVVAHGLCAGCGICESMAGRDRVEMRLTSYGQLRPKVMGPIDPILLGQVLEVCPGLHVSGPEPFKPSEAGRLDPVWGPIKSLHRAWAADEAIRFRAAAGGSLTELGRYLLKSGEVEAILHVRASKSEPALSEAHISTTIEEVAEGSQSRYGPAAPLVHVKTLLDKGLRFAVIAKPCDIAAIRNLARLDGRIKTQIPYCLSIFCGGLPTVHTAYKIAAYQGVRPNELGVLRWRGNGWPGPTHIETKDGRAYDLPYDKVWYDPGVPWTYDIQFRCKICPDAIGELADVACPDGWVMADGKPIHKEAPGVNIAIARTEAGQSLVERAAAAGELRLDAFDLPSLHAMHSDHLERKLGFPARSLGMALAGEPRLQARGYRALAAVVRAGLMGNWRAFRGALRRARAGANREPLD
jgi:coenzyme F420 hydrogenase subunit beta